MLLKQLLEDTGKLELFLSLTPVLSLPLLGSNVVFISLFWNEVVNLILVNIIYDFDIVGTVHRLAILHV